MIVPNSEIVTGPPGVNTSLKEFNSQTFGIATLYKSGLYVIALPINVPPDHIFQV